MVADNAYFVSPYLRQPLRSFEEAMRDRAELLRIRERSVTRAGFGPGQRVAEQPLSDQPG